MDLHHPITREFPQHLDAIRLLRTTNEPFRKTFKEYHRIDDAIYRIEEDIDFATDQETEELKSERVRLKDWICASLNKANPRAAAAHVAAENLHHPIVEELPRHASLIKHLKGTDDKFRRTYDEYHHLDDEIYRVEEGIESATEQELEEMKMKRVRFKDWLFHAITHAPAGK